VNKPKCMHFDVEEEDPTGAFDDKVTYCSNDATRIIVYEEHAGYMSTSRGWEEQRDRMAVALCDEHTDDFNTDTADEDTIWWWVQEIKS
jgi:hypothetical protein